MNNKIEFSSRPAESSPAAIDPKTDANEKSWWDQWNLTYRSQDDGGDVPNELFERTAAVVERNSPAGCVLEIACGAGAMSRRMKFSSYHGLDISPAAIEVARKKFRELGAGAANSIATYEAADFHDWPLPPEPFEVVLCVDAIAYFRDQAFALKRMAQSLRPGGALVLTTINPFIYDLIQRTTDRPLREGSISHWLTRGELHGLVNAAGLAIEKSYTIMPRGTLGFLRVVNSRSLNHLFGQRAAQLLKRAKELAGLGQYRCIVARKPAA